MNVKQRVASPRCRLPAVIFPGGFAAGHAEQPGPGGCLSRFDPVHRFSECLTRGGLTKDGVAPLRRGCSTFRPQPAAVPRPTQSTAGPHGHSGTVQPGSGRRYPSRRAGVRVLPPPAARRGSGLPAPKGYPPVAFQPRAGGTGSQPPRDSWPSAARHGEIPGRGLRVVGFACRQSYSNIYSNTRAPPDSFGTGACETIGS